MKKTDLTVKKTLILIRFSKNNPDPNMDPNKKFVLKFILFKILIRTRTFSKYRSESDQNTRIQPDRDPEPCL